MPPFQPRHDPMETDPGRWGHSLGNVAELLFACLDAAAPRTLVEVGAYAGDVTTMLVDWSAQSGTEIVSIDPEPQPALEALAEANPRLSLKRELSHAALRELPAADAYVIDGDHNHWTVAGELALIAERAGEPFPLLLCHDVAWPHARRDSYYVLETVPEEGRRPVTEGGYVHPDVPGIHDGGLIYQWPASTEGGPDNGVLSAIEEFVAGRPELELAIVPAFFGLGVVFSRDAPYADRLSEILAPYAGHPLLARLERNRVFHLAERERHAARAAWAIEQGQRKDAFLRKLLESRTFDVAVALSRLRQGGEPAYTKDEIRALLPEFDSD